MMKNILIFLLFIISLSVAAQRGSSCPEDLVPKMGSNRQFGYVNLFGEWRIEPIYTKVSPYVDNKAIVMKGLSYGVIDCDGNVLITPQYEKLTNFRYGKIWAMKNGLWGLLDTKGRILIELQYLEIHPIPSTELTWVKKGEQWGLVNEERGNFVCRPQFAMAQVMSNNASLVKSGNFFGVVNHVNCGYLLAPEITRVKKLAPHTVAFQRENKWGLFHEEGKLLMNPEFDTISFKYQDLLLAGNDGLYGLYTLKGKEVLPVQYEEIGDFSEGYLRIKSKGKYGYATRLGKVYIPAVYEEAFGFKNGQAIVKTGTGYGIIDVKNSFLLKPVYAKIERNYKDGYYIISEKDNSGKEKKFLYDVNLKKIADDGFDQVFFEDTISHIRVSLNGQIKYFNLVIKDYAFPGAYENAAAFYKGFAIVGEKEKSGVIDSKGKIVLPVIYDKVNYDFFSNRIVFYTVQNGKTGIADVSGKIILPNDYDVISTAVPNFLKVKKDGKYGILKTNASVVAEPVYDYLSNKKENPELPDWPAVVEKKGKFGLLNEKGEELFPVKANSIEYLRENRYAIRQGKIWTVHDTKGSIVTDQKFDAIQKFSDGLAAVKKGGKWGFIDIKVQVKIPLSFEEAESFKHNMAAVKLNGLWGVIDHKGKWIIKPEYDQYIEEPEGVRIFIKEGKKYMLTKNGILR